jgi:protocatechuate 3,4-dioxygenase beta subunit
MSNTTSAPTEDLTQNVINAYSKIENERTRELVVSFIKLLHGYVKEMKLSEKEYNFAWNFLTKIGLFTNDAEHKYTPFVRNEFLLMGDILGISELVELINHKTDPGSVGASLLGPFYLAGVPFRDRGESTAIDEISGIRVLISGVVLDITNHKPIENAVLDFWQCDTRGQYETEDPSIPKGNLRGKFKTDANGTFEFIGLFPTAYPIIIDGPAGELLVKQAKHKYYRPAHLHFIVSATGYKPFITQIFTETNVKLEDDPTFSATKDTIGNFKKEENKYSIKLQFSLTPGFEEYPVSPINGTGDTKILNNAI